MSRRRRAVAFRLLGLAAGGARSPRATDRGDQRLRPAAPGRVLDRRCRLGPPVDSPRRTRLIGRRVPERFVPPGSLASPGEARGRNTAASVCRPAPICRPASPPSGRPQMFRPGWAEGRGPVEIAVSGADALLVGRQPEPTGAKMDVIVTTEPAGAGPGRTYVAARRRPVAGAEARARRHRSGRSLGRDPGAEKAPAVDLISAESFARRVTLLPAGGR